MNLDLSSRLPPIRLHHCQTTEIREEELDEPVGMSKTEEPPLIQPAPERVHLGPEEIQWLMQARHGDLRAFDWLLTRYRHRAVRLAAHVTRRPAEAEDLAQEAFLRAFAQISRFRGDCAFYTWLYPIVVRCCLNRMRQPGWRREQDRMQEAMIFPESAQTMTQEQHDTRMVVERLLDQLSPPLRAALALRELEGLDYTEIAAILQIPVGTVRSRLNAARTQFRSLWQQAMKEDTP